ncbi:MAG TPA: hypothetical protein VFN13_05640 [Rudaea sp.]|nr:hypothetical protein [Rudaea sp.]
MLVFFGAALLLCACLPVVFAIVAFSGFFATGLPTDFAFLTEAAGLFAARLSALLAGLDLMEVFADFADAFFPVVFTEGFAVALFALADFAGATLVAVFTRAAAFFAECGFAAGFALPDLFFTTVLVAALRFKFAIILHHCSAAVACYSLCASRQQPFIGATWLQVQHRRRPPTPYLPAPPAPFRLARSQRRK